MPADILDLIAAPTPGESVDVLVTWVGGITLLRYRLAISRRREHGALERRASFLVSALAMLLILRGFSWLRPGERWLGMLMLVPATLLPLAMTLFAEGLLRRHVPRAVKWLAVATSGGALLANLAGGASLIGDTAVSAVLLAALALQMVVLVAVLARRDAGSLSRAENGLVRACLLVALVGVPLAATDFRFVLGWPAARMGTIGALLFCYTLLRRPEERAQLRRWMRDVARLLGRAFMACLLLLVAMRGAPREMLEPLFVLATTLVIALAIADRLGAGAGRDEHALLRWLARPPAASMAAFQRELRHLPLTADALVIGEADLAPYNPEALRRVLGGRDGVRTLAELRVGREDAGEGHALAARGADELTDLLERTGMTHVALLNAAPLCLLLANVPELPGHEEAAVALGAVARHGQLALAHAGMAAQ